MSSSTSFLHSRRYKRINIYPPFLDAGIGISPGQIADPHAQVEQAGKIEPLFS